MAVTVSELRAFVGMDDADFQKGIQQIKTALGDAAAAGNEQGKKLADALDNASKKSVASLDSITKKAISTGKALSLAVTAPLVLLGKKAVEIAAGFEQNMDILQATSGASGEQMKKLSKLAVDLGADIALPGTSAADAAQAMTELIKSGVSLNDTMTASRPVLQLAAASLISNAEAAKLVGAALNEFHLAGTEAGAVADIFATASAHAAGGAGEMAIALKSGGAAAATAGLSLKEFVAVLSLMAQRGIVGERAGTSIAATLALLSKPTTEASKKMKELDATYHTHIATAKGMADVSEQLHLAFAKLTSTQKLNAAQTLVGRDGMNALITLADSGASGLSKMETAITKQGSAAKLAAAANKGLKGAMDAMASAFETAAQSGIQPIIKDLTAMAKAAGTLIGKFADLPEGTRRFIVEVLAGAAALGPLIIGIAKVTQAISTLKKGIMAARAGEGIAAWLASGPVMIAIGLIIAGIVALYLAWTQNWGHIREVTFDAMNTIVSAFETFAGGISDIWNGALNALSGEWKEGWEQIKRGSNNALHALSIGAQKAGEERARIDQQQADEAIARTKKTIAEQVKAHKDAAKGAGSFGLSADATDTEAGKQLKKFNEELAETIIKLSSAKRGETKVQQDLLAQYPLINAAMRQSLINKREELDKINKVQEATKRFKEELARVTGHIAALRSGKSTILADMAKQFPGVNRELLAHLNNLTQWEKHLEIMKSKATAVMDQLRSQRTEWMQNATNNHVAAAAVKLYGEEMLKLNPKLRTAEDVFNALDAAQQGVAENFAEIIRKANMAAMTKQIKDMRLEFKAMSAEAPGVFKMMFADEEIFAMRLYKRELSEISAEEMEQAKALRKEGQTAEHNTIIYEAYNKVQNANRLAAANSRADLVGINIALDAQMRMSALASFAWERYGVKLSKVSKDAYRNIKEAFDKTNKALADAQLKQSFQDIFATAFKNVNQGFKGFFSSIISGVEDLLREIAAKFLAARVTELLFHLLPGGGKFLEGIMAGGTIGRGRAVGGRFDAGESFLVGENGPELVGFDHSGRVMRNSDLQAAAGGGGGDIHIYQTFNVADTNGIRRSAASSRSDALRLAEVARKKNLVG